MCDYSLEMYDTRSAREGEVYVTTRFPSGSIGLTAPEDAATAICLACGSRLMLENLSPTIQRELGVTETEEVTFAYLDEGLYHDGVAFDNGVRVTLCRLGTGVMVSLKDPPRPAKERQEGKARPVITLAPAE
jgi:hypothetical protein